MPPRPTAENWRGSPTSTIRELGQGGELGVCGGAGFVDDDGGPGRQVVDGAGWTGRVAMFDEELVQRVGGYPGLGGEYFG
jgi:hypothetical protein